MKDIKTIISRLIEIIKITWNKLISTPKYWSLLIAALFIFKRYNIKPS